MPQMVSLPLDQLSVIASEETEPQLSRNQSINSMESYDRHSLKAPQPPGANVKSIPGAYNIITNHDEMAAKKDPKSRYRNLHQLDTPSISTPINEEQHKESFVHHTENPSKVTDSEYQKRLEEKVLEAEKLLDRPRDSFDLPYSWNDQPMHQDAKMFDIEADSGRSRFPEQGQNQQVDNPQGVIVTGDRGIVTHPDTMFGTALPGNYGPLQDNGLTIAMAVNEDDDERLLPFAVEYDPDAKPPIYLNRRFRLYMSATICLFFVVILTSIISVMVLRGGSSFTISLENSAPTFSPTSLQESSYLQQFAISLGYQEWHFTEDSPHARAANWIMEEDERKLSQEDAGLTQRFLLAVFYFTTTSNGQSPWQSCNPNFTDSSDVICQFQRLSLNEMDEVVYTSESSYRWLSKEHECYWVGNLCDDSNTTRAIDLCKFADMIILFTTR
jgi:hypothetical protein